MRKNKFTNVLIIEDKNCKQAIINQPTNKIFLNQNFHNNKIYFPISQKHDKLLPYKLSQKVDMRKKQKNQHIKFVNDENKDKQKTKRVLQQNIRKKSFNRQKKFIDLFLDDNKNAKRNQISRNTISFRKPSKVTVHSFENHVYRSKNIKSLKHMYVKINNTICLENQHSKDITKEESSNQNLKKTKSQINSLMTSPKINKDYSAYLPSKKYSRSKLYSTRHSPQKVNIGSDEDWICQKLIRQQVYAFQNQQTQI